MERLAGQQWGHVCSLLLAGLLSLSGISQVSANGPEVEALPPPTASPGPAATTPATERPPAVHEVGSDLNLRAVWNHGLCLESPHRDFRMKVGGRVQIDTTAFTAGPGPNQPPGQAGLDPPLTGATNFRRGRFRLEGRMYETFDFAAEYDYINQLTANNEIFPTETGEGPNVAVTDLWLQVREFPWLGIVRVGNQKDPFGYEHLITSRWMNFMERSFSMDAFVAPFNLGFVPGIQSLNRTADGRIGWQVGIFKNTTNPFGFGDTSGASETAGRLVWVPWLEDRGFRLLHLGIAGRTMQPRNGVVRFRSRGDIRNGPPGPRNSIYADAGVLAGSWQNMLGLELVGNNGPWSFQAEYFGSWLYDGVTTDLGPLETNGFQPAPGTPVGTVFYQGGYAEVLYFLTGESRSYSTLEYRFGRPIPRSNFYCVRSGGKRGPIQSSPGAWQLGFRYNYLGLSDGEVNGGVLNAVTIGLNWLLNPNARVYFNYDLTYRDFANTPFTKDAAGNVIPAPSENGSGFINGFGLRLAFDF